MKSGKSILSVFILALAFWCVPTGELVAEPAFVGMQVQGVSSDVASAFGIKKPEGVLVRDVALGGPANKSGILRGDLIVAFADSEIETFEQLVVKVKELSAGDSVPITVIRQGKTLELTMVTEKWTPAWQVTKGIFASIPAVGLTLSAITQKVRDRFDIRWGSNGVIITLIDPEKADSMDLQRGEIIHQVNQIPVWNPNDLAKMYEEAKASGKKSLLLLVEGVNGFRFSILKVK